MTSRSTFPSKHAYRVTRPVRWMIAAYCLGWGAAGFWFAWYLGG